MSKPIPPEFAIAFTAAFQRYVRGEFEGASDDFARLAAHPDQAMYEVSSGWSLFTKGIHLLLNEGDRIGAQVHFQNAYEQLTKGKDSVGASRAEVGFLICRGQDLAGDNHYKEAIEQYVKAKGILEFLKPRLQQEQPFLQRVALGLDLDIAALNYIDDVVGHDYDGARGEMAEVRDAHDKLLAIQSDEDAKTHLGATLSVTDGLLPFVQASEALSQLRVEVAWNRFKAALPYFKAGSDAIGPLGPKKRAWKHHAQLFKSVHRQCEAGIAHAKALSLVIDGQFMKAPSELRKAATLYDEASALSAGAGMYGVQGLYGSAGVRNILTSWAEAIEGRIEKELWTLPEFATLAIDKNLGAVLASDYMEVWAAFSVGAWKLCMTGVGGILEAMLIDRLQDRWPDVVKACGLPQNATPAQIKDWKLAEMIDRAEKAGLLTPGNKYLSDALRDYRNLIHPLKNALGKYKVDREAALGSLRALLQVIGGLK